MKDDEWVANKPSYHYLQLKEIKQQKKVQKKKKKKKKKKH